MVGMKFGPSQYCIGLNAWELAKKREINEHSA